MFVFSDGQLGELRARINGGEYGGVVYQPNVASFYARVVEILNEAAAAGEDVPACSDPRKLDRF